jgi:hypothetical protein
MGYAPAMQGFRELLGFETDESARPVSGTGRGHEAVDAWLDEAVVR